MCRPAMAAKSKQPPSPTAQKIQALKGQVDDVSADEAKLLDQLDAQAGDLRNSLDRDRGQALVQRDDVASKEQDLSSRRQAQDDLRQQAAAEVAKQNDVLAQLRARKSEFQAQIFALQRQSDAL